MQDLIANITEVSGLPTAKAEKAVGILLGLVKTQGNQARVGELFAKLPGADALVADHAGDGAGHGGTGLVGMLAGGMMGGPLAAITKLSAAGLSMVQIKQVASLTLDHAKSTAGKQLVREVASAIPGLSGFV